MTKNLMLQECDKENIKDCIIQDEKSIFHSAQFDLYSILFKHKAITPFD